MCGNILIQMVSWSSIGLSCPLILDNGYIEASELDNFLIQFITSVISEPMGNEVCTENDFVYVQLKLVDLIRKCLSNYERRIPESLRRKWGWKNRNRRSETIYNYKTNSRCLLAVTNSTYRWRISGFVSKRESVTIECGIHESHNL